MSPDLSLAVAANRDEFHARPTLPADFWPDHSQVLAGRDQEAGGTWMGVTRTGRFAALTNYVALSQVGARSRGELVSGFLTGSTGALDFAKSIHGEDYAGFNLIMFDGQSLVHCANDGNGPRRLEPGVHGVSNAALDAAWPKMRASNALLHDAILAGRDVAYLLAGMRDSTPPTDDQIPAGDAPIELRRRTSSCFVIGDDYGTRCTTVVLIRRGDMEYVEQSYGPEGRVTERREFSIALTPNCQLDAVLASGI